MKINVASKNQTKINAVKEALKLYPKHFLNVEIKSVAVNIEEFGHPKNIGQTMQGAVERAKTAFQDCDYSFGLEGGLIQVPLSKTGFMEVAACAIFDGKDICLGLGPAFEWPKDVLKLILKNEADASQAFKKLGLTKSEKLGAAPGGIIGQLTFGRLTREEQIKQSIITALIQLENLELYKS